MVAEQLREVCVSILGAPKPEGSKHTSRESAQGVLKVPMATTIYSGWNWDEVLGSAVLATALIKKGYRVYLEFPAPNELRELVISKAYAVGIGNRSGAVFRDVTAIEYRNERKLGLVLKYDELGNSSVVMRFANMSSLTETVLEYVTTLNVTIKVPQELLNDVRLLNEAKYDKLSKIGKTLFRAFKMNYNNKEFRNLMYSFAFNAVNYGSLKLPEELIKEANKYFEALKIANRIVKEKRYETINGVKVLVISDKYGDEVVREYFDTIKPVAYDLLLRVCKSDKFALLVLRTEYGHTLRVCLQRTDISFVKLISAIPEDLSDKLLISLRGNHMIIKFKDASESSLDNMLKLCEIIVNASKQ